MHNSAISFLTLPVRNIGDSRSKKVAILTTGIVIIAFLILLEPFSIRNANEDPVFMLYLAGYGILASLTLLFFEFFVKPRVYYFSADKLPLYRIIIFYIIFLLFLSVVNYGYYRFIQVIFKGHPFFQFPDTPLIEFFQKTFFLGLFLVAGFVVYFRLKNRIQKLSSEVAFTNGIISLKAERGNDFLRIPISDLLFIESKGNYVQVRYCENGGSKQKLIRTTLKKIESEIAGNQLVRCHQSFIINSNKLRSFQHGSRGASLELHGLEEPVPVSRKYVSTVKSLIDGVIKA